MRQQSRILGELAKSAQGNAQFEATDAMISVPPLGLMTLNVPRPSLKHVTAISATPAPDSFKFSEESVFNVGGTQPLASIGPGLWQVSWSLSKRVAGAISDTTSTLDINLAINDGTGASVILAIISNGQNFQEYFYGSFVLLIPSPISFEFRRTRVAGLGTAVNLALITIHADKQL